MNVDSKQEAKLLAQMQEANLKMGYRAVIAQVAREIIAGKPEPAMEVGQ